MVIVVDMLVDMGDSVIDAFVVIDTLMDALVKVDTLVAMIFSFKTR